MIEISDQTVINYILFPCNLGRNSEDFYFLYLRNTTTRSVYFYEFVDKGGYDKYYYGILDPDGDRPDGEYEYWLVDGGTRPKGIVEEGGLPDFDELGVEVYSRGIMRLGEISREYQDPDIGIYSYKYRKDI